MDGLKYYYLAIYGVDKIVYSFIRSENNFNYSTIEQDINLLDEYGCFKYKEQNGKIIERTPEERGHLEILKSQALQSIDSRTNQLIEAGKSVNNTQYGLDTIDQSNWTALVAGIDNLPDDIPTRSKDGKTVMIKKTALKQVYSELVTHVMTCRMSGWAEKEKVNSCKTIEEIKAYQDNR